MRPWSRNPGGRSAWLALALAALASAAWGAETITICKTTVPAGGTGFSISRANGAGALPSFTLNDGQCTTFNMTGQDHYNRFTETVPGGWTLANIFCVHTTTPVTILGANSNPAFQPGDNTVTLDLNEANVTCTFVNQRQPQEPSCWARICVKKYRDTNGDGLQGSGEPTLPGWTFQFVNGPMVITATTNNTGVACANVPAPATYTVSEVQQPGWTPTLPLGGTKTVTVAAGQVVNLSFGNRPKKETGTGVSSLCSPGYVRLTSATRAARCLRVVYTPPLTDPAPTDEFVACPYPRSFSSCRGGVKMACGSQDGVRGCWNASA